MGTSRTIPAVSGVAFLEVVLIDDSGQYWNNDAGTLAMEDYNASNIADYGIETTEDGSTGNYRYTIPTTLPAGGYTDQASDSIDGTLTEVNLADKVATGNIDWDGVSLTPVIYIPKLVFNRDDTTDEYTVDWHRGAEPLTSGVTSPTITVINRADFTTLFGPTAMPQQTGDTGLCKYDATGAEQIPENASAIVELKATIDGSVRTSHVPVGSSATVVGGMTQAALAQFVTDDTGETSAAAGSVGQLAHGWDALRASHVIVGSFGESNQKVSSVDVSVSFSFGSTGYCSRSDINDIFGGNNVTTWADLNNDSDGDVITARVARSIAWATTEINDRLRGGPYEIPLPSTVAATIVDLCATLAGVWLYRSRGVDDESEIDKYKWHWDRVEKTLSEIRAGKRRLDATPSVDTGGQAPFAV